MSHTKQTSSKSGFTLVELIVVIVILAILATIAFLSFGSQASSARDSTRLSDLASLSKGLGVQATTSGKYPTPDKAVGIWSSGRELASQGEIGTSVKSVIKASADGFMDPLNKNNYMYTINSAGSKYRVATYLENKDSVAFDIGKYLGGEEAGAAYGPEVTTNGVLYSKGDEIAIIYVKSGSIVTPINEVPVGSMSMTDTGIDLGAGAANPEIVAVTTNGGTAETISPSLASSYNPTRYPGCDTVDIQVGDQVWAACNVGAKKASEYAMCTTENTGACTADRIGYYFKWGNNTPYDTVGSINTSVVAGTDSGSWINGGQGPCASGYHVPTETEWNDTLKYITSGTCNVDIAVAEGVTGFEAKTISTLYLSNGGRYTFNGNIPEPGTHGEYWSSSTGTTFDDIPTEGAGNMYISSGEVGCAGNTEIDHTNGYIGNFENAQAVRCIKNP